MTAHARAALEREAGARTSVLVPRREPRSSASSTTRPVAGRLGGTRTPASSSGRAASRPRVQRPRRFSSLRLRLPRPRAGSGTARRSARAAAISSCWRSHAPAASPAAAPSRAGRRTSRRRPSSGRLQLQHAVGHRLQEPAVVRDEQHGRVQRASSRSSHSSRTTSRWFVGSSSSSTSGRAASARASEARVSSPPEKVSSGRRGRRRGSRGRAGSIDARAPLVAAGALQRRLRAGVAAQRLASCAPPAIACSSAPGSSSRGPVGQRRPDVLLERAPQTTRRPLVVQRHARRGRARSRRRRARSRRPGCAAASSCPRRSAHEGQPLSGARAEGDVVEEPVRRRAPCAGWRRSGLPWSHRRRVRRTRPRPRRRQTRPCAALGSADETAAAVTRR